MQRRQSAFETSIHGVSGFLLLLLLTGQVALALPAAPASERSNSSLSALPQPFEESLIRTAPTAAAEDRALAHAVSRYTKGQAGDTSTLEAFLDAYPDSGWRLALLTNLGLVHYHNGYFSKALDAWERAWEAGRKLTDPASKALTDRAIGELIRMHARLGHAERLAQLLEEVKDRPLIGPATEAVAGAKQGLWMMQNEPGVAYLCGPMALRSLSLLGGQASADKLKKLEEYLSGPHGVSFADVAALAQALDLPFQAAHRSGAVRIPVPSLVHWKVNHYAAIVGERNGSYHVKDPTFGTDLWVTRAAIETESSGYFLIPKATALEGWRLVGQEEGRNIRGMGYTGSSDQDDTSPEDDKERDCSDNKGMCGYNIHGMTVSLNLSDTPVGYRPPIGPAVFLALTYNQREANQPAVPSFFNFGPKWTSNWLSYIVDNPAIAGASVRRYVAGGGGRGYTGFNGATGTFTPETQNASTLVLVTSSPIRYERRMQDGSREVYEASDGATLYPRRIFLSRFIDATGNAVTLSYDPQRRLTTITDATGRNTTFSYELPAQPLLVTRVTDPFGRSAQIEYDASGRLNRITDVLGLVSSFTYGSGSFINSKTTPYGTTQFAYTESGTTRSLEVTDPLGFRERVEYRHQAPGVPFSETVAPSGMNIDNRYVNGRNTFYWDKHAYQQAAGNYTQARIKHWFHLITNSNITDGTLESIKYPLQGRVWFNNPGSVGFYSGTYDRPSLIGRVMDDGVTQLRRITYNSLGNVASTVDPAGRETVYEYDVNQADVLRIRQRTSASGYSTVAEFSYNAQHLPLTYTDAAGQVTTYAYNAAGQPRTVTNALGQVTEYQYNALGYLTRIVNANGRTQARFTYDASGRVATRIDSQGHTVAFEYDNLDRLTRATYPDGTFYLYQWDRLELASVTDREGRVTSYGYDANRNLIAVTDPLSRTTRYDYYPNGQLRSLTDANGTTTQWQRDIQSRVTAKVYADASGTTFAYQPRSGRLSSTSDALGQTKTVGYTIDDRVASLSYANALNPTPSVSFAYDPYFARIVSMADGAGTTQYQYHPVGSPGALQLAQEDGSFQNDTIAYQYDALGRINGRNVDASAESYIYDVIGRLLTKTNPLGEICYTYLGETDQPTSLSILNSPVRTDWQYLGNAGDRRLRRIINSGAARSFRLTTTAENRITDIAETINNGSTGVGQWTYDYDPADRLFSAIRSSGDSYQYTLDELDNPTSVTAPAGTRVATYNNLNQLLSFNGQSTVHDANGNLTEDATRYFDWDAQNRLVRVRFKAQPGKSVSFQYDGLDRRRSITVQDPVTGSIETRHLWCGTELCQARDANDAVIRRYYEDGEVRLATGQRIYYGKDQIGSVRDAMDIATGAKLDEFDYEPYGQPTTTPASIAPDFRFAQMYYEPVSGLHLANYRAYDPLIGRWLSRDPIEERGGVNVYGYAFSRPINLADPLGLVPNCTNPTQEGPAAVRDWEERTHNDSWHLPSVEFYPIKISVGGTQSLRPSRRRNPIGEEVVYEVWLVHLMFRQDTVITYQQLTQHMISFCTRTETDECGSEQTTPLPPSRFDIVSPPKEIGRREEEIFLYSEKIRKLGEFGI